MVLNITETDILVNGRFQDDEERELIFGNSGTIFEKANDGEEDNIFKIHLSKYKAYPIRFL